MLRGIFIIAAVQLWDKSVEYERFQEEWLGEHDDQTRAIDGKPAAS
jgi:hypothetical protein